MRILLLTHAFNSLTQRLFVELRRDGHDLSVEFDINDAVAEEAVALFEPEVVLAPYLRRAIPASIWSRIPCLVVHPGPRGDRGPSALDWAVLRGEPAWGVTVLQANAEMDAGDVWAWREFAMRPARKGSLYRNEVTECAVAAVREALARLAAGERPQPLDPQDSRWNPPMKQADRAIDWTRDDTATVLRKIRSADGAPGLRDTIEGRALHLYDARAAHGLGGAPGAIVASDGAAIARATTDGAVWIGHLREAGVCAVGPKLSAAALLASQGLVLPKAEAPDASGIRYEENGGIGYLHFPFYNGAMSTVQCRALLDAYRSACARPARVIALMGGEDFWSNGIHLHVIEAAASPADESWNNIEAMNDLAQAILTTDDRLVVSALQGNAAAGGVFLALAADRVYARAGVVLNPHYKSMGNLYGSEYWTYVLPRRAGPRGSAVMQDRLPLGVPEAVQLGLVDEYWGEDAAGFRAGLAERLERLAADPGFEIALAQKRARRARDEAHRPLSQYRAEEMACMRLNFYGFDPSYHVARYNFVHRVPYSRTPYYLARHRTLGPGGGRAGTR